MTSAPPPGREDLPPPVGPWRFESCVRADVTPAEGAAPDAPPVPARHRRCPTGVVADVDCPEHVGVRCRFHEDRAGAPPTVVSPAEARARAVELALDFLTPRYRRRVAALVDASAAARRPVPGVVDPVPEDAGAGVAPHLVTFGQAPLNVETDDVQRESTCIRPPEPPGSSG